jgi:hypothetical protein
MQNNDLEKFPIIDLEDEAALAAIFPSEHLLPNVRTATSGLKDIFTELPPKDDPAPIAFMAGWNAEKPTVDIVGIDGQFLQDAAGKQGLANGFRNMILRQRSKGQETFCVTMINAAWFRRMPAKSSLHTVRTALVDGIQDDPEKSEVVLVDTIWQDGQRILMAEIIRSKTGDSAPKLGPWRDISKGSTMTENRFWQAIAPALCSLSYADAVLAAFEGEGDLKGGSC